MMTGLRYGRLALGTVACLLCATNSAYSEEAVPWDLVPHIGLSQIYTDNVKLTPLGQQDHHEHITQADIGFTLHREGGRARANLVYNLQDLTYWRDQKNDTFYHQFSGDGQIELLPDHLFFDGTTTYSQRFITRQDGFSGDNINALNNRSDVFTLRLSPSYRQRMSNLATGLVRYTHDRVDYRESGASRFDSESNRVLAQLDSGTYFSTFGWQVSFRRSETDFNDGSSVTLQTAEALLRWHITDRFSVFGAGGEEDNEYEQDPRRARPDDTFWRAGLTWQPGRRTNLEGYYGERFFGDTYGGSLEHRFRNSQLSMEYSEGLTTINQFEIERIVIPVVDENGLPLLVDGEPVFLELEYPDLQSGVYLRKRFTAGFSGERRKTSWGLRGFDERREFEINNQNERLKGIAANIAWRVVSRTRILLNGSIQRATYQDTEREDEYQILGTGFVRDIGPRTFASLQYRHVKLNSNQDQYDYRENRITASFRKTF